MSALKQNSSFGTAQIILFFSIAILVIVVAVPVLLIFFNAFWVNGEFNVADVAKIILEPETYQALVNSLIIATGTTIGSTMWCSAKRTRARGSLSSTEVSIT